MSTTFILVLQFYNLTIIFSEKFRCSGSEVLILGISSNHDLLKKIIKKTVRLLLSGSVQFRRKIYILNFSTLYWQNILKICIYRRPASWLLLRATPLWCQNLKSTVLTKFTDDNDWPDLIQLRMVSKKSAVGFAKIFGLIILLLTVLQNGESHGLSYRLIKLAVFYSLHTATISCLCLQ